MQDQVEQTFVCPVLIGRAPELAILHSIVDQVQRGSGRVVLVSGEAGVGKSRLVAEAKAFAVSQGFLLLQGNCFQTDQAIPYSPFLDLIRTQVIAPAFLPALPDFHQFAQEFSRRFPELTLLTPDLAAPPAAPSSDPEQEKRHLFAMITRFFTTQVKRQPVLLLIEDLHWSDETSLEVLLHLARYCAHLPFMLLVTYRDEEVTSVLTHFLAACEREHHAQFLSLERLSRQEVEAMLQAIPALNEAVSIGLVDSIYRLTEGNPFFIEELLKSMLVSETALGHKGGWERKLSVDFQSPLTSIPQSIRATVHQRAAHLSSQAKQVLTLAAIAGRRFDFSVLQQILHCAETDLLRLVKELIAAQLVVEESADQFSFRHALTREAIYAELLARERRALHRTLAETLEQCSLVSLPEAYLADLAYHFFEAGAWAKALEYGQRAGERALALYAPRAALEHFTRAVQALAHLPDLPPATLYRARGKAYETLGEFELSRDDYQQALALAQQARDTRLEWQSLLDLGFLWASRDYTQSRQWFHQALDLAKVLADTQLQAHSLNRLGNWLVNIGQAEEGVRLHQEALTLFETGHDTQGMAETLDLMGMGCGISGDTIQAAERLEQAIALFRASGDQAHLISSLPTHVGYLCPGGCDTTYSVCASLEVCAAELAEARRLARQMDSLPGQAYIEWVASLTFASFGELGMGLRHAKEALRIATDIQHAQWTVGAYWALGDTYLLLREANLAIQALEAGLGMAAAIGSAWWTGNLRAYLALACLLKGAVPRAEAVLQAGIARDQVPRNAPERRMTWAWGEVALANGEPEEALRLVEHLLDTTPGPTTTQPIPQLLYLRGKALLALQRSPEAVQVLEEAKRGALARQERPLLWQIHGVLGHAYQRAGQRDQAQGAFAASRSIIAALAATIDDATIRERFSRSALTCLPREGRLLARRTESEQFGGLTRRERAVAALIAQGKTNREIADALVVSERTVETHVSNILSKLGVTSRRHIAAWALDKGLPLQEQDG
jgi:DNA-binding CsgD family transcriptional regulator/tetratricopeptide (TPR) repeat protein